MICATSAVDTQTGIMSNVTPDYDKQQLNREYVKILIVEDDLIYTQVLKLFLRKVKSLKTTVHSCTSAGDVVYRHDIDEYDIILIDYHLPNVTGVNLIKKLAEKYGDYCPPCIILTAEGDTEIAVEALRVNAHDFIPKTQVTADSLTRSISNAIYKHQLKLSVLQRTEELERVNKQLGNKSREMQDFYQTVSHEVKTPLAAAREFTSILKDEILGPINDKQSEIIDLTITSCDQIAAHFNELIEVSRIDAKKIVLNKSDTTIETILVRSIAACARDIEKKSINLKTYSEDSSIIVNVDCNRVTQVLTNILGNAVKYSPDGGDIELKVEYPEDDKIRVSVTDQGCGISEHDCENIFNRLYQVDNESQNNDAPGLGLGLSIARQLVELHQGELCVISKIDRGSTFFFEIPICN